MTEAGWVVFSIIFSSFKTIELLARLLSTYATLIKINGIRFCRTPWYTMKTASKNQHIFVLSYIFLQHVPCLI